MSHVLPLVRFVEDDEVFRTSQELLLRTHGFEVEGYGSVQEFLAADDLSRPGCIVLDVRMPGMTGLELQQLLNDKGIEIPIIFLSGHGDIAMAVHTMQSGAVSFLEKPVAPRKLLETIASAVEASLTRWRADDAARKGGRSFGRARYAQQGDRARTQHCRGHGEDAPRQCLCKVGRQEPA